MHTLILSDIHLGNDAQFSYDLVVSRVNSELANNLGNLASRSLNLVDKYFDGKVPPPEVTHPSSIALRTLGLGVAARVKAEVVSMAPNAAVGHVVDFLSAANKYMEDRAPWKSAKDSLADAGEALYNSLEVLRIAGILLSPVMPSKTAELLKRIGWSHAPKFSDAQAWGLLPGGQPITKGDPLFPRVEIKSV